MGRPQISNGPGSGQKPWRLHLEDWASVPQTARQISQQTPCEPYTHTVSPAQVGVFTLGGGPQRICTLADAACARSRENSYCIAHSVLCIVYCA